MNDAQLDKKLKEGFKQAHRFFGGRFVVCGRADAAVEHCGRPSPRGRVWRRTCLAGACVMAAAAICAAVIFTLGGRSAAVAPQQTDALLEQTVCLSGGREYRMSYIPVDMPDDGAGLMTVLWEKASSGDPKMAYYSLFQAGDTAYPAMILPFPEPNYDMLLISSGNSSLHSLGYRLVGFSGDTLKTWWSEDGIPQGLLSLTDGVAVEHRLSGSKTYVTYIVPVQVSESGRIALPVEALRMAVGERILLIGADNADINSQSGLLAAEQQEENGVSAVLFKALRPGRDVVSVGGKGEAHTISVDIGE